MKIQFKDLSSGDEREFVSLIKSTYSDSPFAFTFDKAPSEESMRALFARKMELMHNGKLIDIVAKCNRRILGECEMALSYRNKTKTGVVGILVKKEFRRKAIGRALLASAELKAKGFGISCFVAEISEANSVAVKFFEKCGFKQAGSNYGKILLLKC
ncbi:MAG: GNAT family N-acetyltransferase [Candidatus Micrarchaeaceae archaeon]